MPQFALAAGDGVGVQSGDAGEVGDASRAVLLSEEADEQTSGAFVGGGDEAIEAAMLACQETARMLPAVRTSAAMEVTPRMFGDHRTVTPSGGKREGYPYSIGEAPE
jgi:hypothetical protein